jgi:hypothetical protein
MSAAPTQTKTSRAAKEWVCGLLEKLALCISLSSPMMFEMA